MKLKQKILSKVLIIMLLLEYFLPFGNLAIAAFSENVLINQNDKTNVKNVNFDSYLKENTHKAIYSIGEKASIFLKLNVKDTGSIVNGRVEFINPNFLLDESFSNEYIKGIKNNTIELNNIENGGTELTIEVPIKMLDAEIVDTDVFSKISKLNFNGTYVDENKKETRISKDMYNKIIWHGTANSSLSGEITTILPYNEKNEFGVMMQIKVLSEIIENKLPISNTKIEVAIPNIQGVKASRVNVIANTIKGNDKKEKIDFNISNYTYNAEQEMLNITTKNNVTEGKIDWNKGKEEYIINVIYEGKEIYNKIKQQTKANNEQIEILTKSEIEVFNNEQTKLNTQNTISGILKETKGRLAEENIKVTNKVSKAYLYSNLKNNLGNKKETNYEVKYEIQVNDHLLLDTIELKQQYDKFINKDNTILSTTIGEKNYTYNKNIKVSKKEFDKILGENGVADIFLEDGTTKIGTINSKTEIDNEENYYIDISQNNTNNIVIKTSKPLLEGTIIFKFDKAIKKDINLTQKQIQNIEKLKIDSNNSNDIAEMTMQETTTVAELQINQENLSTVDVNENVELRIVLDNSDIYNALYENPTFKIILPKQIKDIKLNSYNMLMNNGLEIQEIKINKENENQVINLKLEGKQQDYTIGADYKGTIIILNLNLNLDRLSTTSKENLSIDIKNNNPVSLNNEQLINKEINIVAPFGVVAVNSTSRHEKNETANTLSISDEIKNIKIEPYTNNQTVTISGKIINNYPNNIKNMVVLGRIPSKGNKNIETNEDFKSTFDTTLDGKIEVIGIDSTKYKIYYSDNLNATKDLQKVENNWTETPSANVKSYLIEFKDTIDASTNIEYEYTVKIPDQLETNQVSSHMFKLYYTNVSNIGEIEESKVSPIIRITTGEGPILNITINPVLPNGVNFVRDGQYIKMKATIKNTGKVAAEDVKLIVEDTENVKLAEYSVSTGVIPSLKEIIEESIGTIEPNEQKEVNYYIRLKRPEPKEEVKPEGEIAPEEESPKTVPEVDYKVQHNIKAKTSGITNEIKSNDVEFEIQEGNVLLSMGSDKTEEMNLTNGYRLNICITVSDLLLKESKSKEVEFKIPEGLTYINATIRNNSLGSEKITKGISYDDNTRSLKVKIDDDNLSKRIDVFLDVNDGTEKFQLYAKLKNDKISESYSNVLEYEISQPQVKISEMTTTSKYVKENQIIEYKVNVSNIGNIIINQLLLKTKIPEGVELEKATFNYAGQEQIVNYLKDDELVIEIPRLEIGESKDIIIQYKANLLKDKTEDEKKIENQLNVVYKFFKNGKVETLELGKTNVVTNFIEYDENQHKNNNFFPDGNQDEPIKPSTKRFKITGTAWLDTNKNGKRDAEESLLSDIPVILLDKMNNKVVIDPETNQEKRTITDKDGKYVFDNLEPKQYIVLFIYDHSNYTVTEYQRKDVPLDLNSDFIDVEATINGENKIIAMSDNVIITNDNVRDIDFGAYKSEKFDLRLDKYISKVILSTPTIGTKEYNYKDKKVAKVEVLAKNVGKSSAIIEYKIVVKNEGAIPGYVKKIADYLPNEMKFISQMNKDWYVSNNGELYNTSLQNVKINPGESKEVILVVSQEITEENMGIHTNKAEIYECYNEQAIEDMDSKPGNKNENEDDMSEAQLVTSIVTGKILGYTFIGLISISLIAFSAYEIRKRVLNK